ncbi:paired amphipathic helix protein Sin3-like 4 isoform X1 [Apium graveolens]|uniref:paired amphipathic helix protein Sin3-like 4 isoform X1 n=1 Tax=Apium graveolens TaxID=4045 RepID=UPI003D79B177
MTSKDGSKLTSNVALSFLSEVKKRFNDEKGKYEDFVEIMKGFMARRIDIANVIARVKELLKGHRDLILGFNAFLPEEYVITLPSEDEPTPPKKSPVRFGDAIDFINKIKARFEGNENVYKTFLHILDMYGKQTKTIKEVNQEVVSLFGDQVDLIEEFGHFLPGPSGQPSNISPHSRRNHISHHNYRSSSVSAVRTGRVEKAAVSHDGRHFNVDGPDPNYDRFSMGNNKDLHRKSNKELERREVSKWRKRRLDDRDCDYRDVQHTSPICKTDPEIEEPDQFYRGAFWSNEHVPISVKVYSRHRDQNGEKRHKDKNHENREIERSDNIAPGGKDESVCNMSQFPSKDELLVKPINELDLSNCERCTPSYRLLPKDYPIPSASRRTDADAVVLNDYWVSVTSGSEDYSFKHMRKNQYEESLFHCEDDRYELDMLLESVKAAIKSVEKLLKKINDNTIKTSSIHIEDHFTALNLRCIERVYGDHGLDVMDVLRKNPPLTLEVILHRLKQKQEEWAECRSDYSKVWAEIYVKNYHRSLDHRSFYFKQEESKRLSSKALLAEIKEISKKQQDEDDVLLSIATGSRRPVIPNMEFQLPDPDIHVYVYWLIKKSCQYMCSDEGFGRIMKVYTTLLEPMFGVSLHLQHAENTEGDFVKAGVGANGFTPNTGETDGSPIGVAATNNIRRTNIANSPHEPSSSSARSVSNNDGVDQDSFHDPDQISANSDTIDEKHRLEEVENNVTLMDEMSNFIKNEQADYSSISAAEVEDNCERVHEKSKPGLLRKPDEAAKISSSSAEGGDCSKSTSDLIGAVTESVNDQECNEESRVQCTTEKEEGELPPYGDYEDHNLQGHGEADHEPEDSATSMQYQTRDSEDDEVEDDVNDDDKGYIYLNSVKPLIVHVPSLLHDKEKEKTTQMFYGNDSFYVLFRLYQTLYDRMKSVKSSAERNCRVSNDTTPSDMCASFMNAFCELLDGSSDNTEFEDHCRTLMGAESYVLFTLDKLVKKLVNQLETIATNDMDNKLLQLYAYEKSRHGIFAEKLYHDNARALLHNEYIYRIECSYEPLHLSIQLMDYGSNKPEPGVVSMDSIIQSYMDGNLLHPEEKVEPGVVLKRNKRKFAFGDELSNTDLALEGLEIYNGLECRINIYTDKVSYVLGTEDYMCRKKTQTLLCNGHTNHSVVSLARPQGLDRLLMSCSKQ